MTRRIWLIAVRASVGVRARKRAAWKVDSRSSIILDVARGAGGGDGVCEEVMKDSREVCMWLQRRMWQDECGDRNKLELSRDVIFPGRV